MLEKTNDYDKWPPHVQEWVRIVFRISREGFDFLSYDENKDLLSAYHKYLGWKIKKTLGEPENITIGRKKYSAILIDNRTYFYRNVFDDLESKLVVWFNWRQEQHLQLDITEVWNKFNNSVYNYLLKTYRQQVPKQSKNSVCDTYQRAFNYEEDDLVDIEEAYRSALPEGYTEEAEEVEKEKEKRIASENSEIYTYYEPINSKDKEENASDSAKYPLWDLIHQFWRTHKAQLSYIGWKYGTFFDAVSNGRKDLLNKIIAGEKPDFSQDIWRIDGKQNKALQIH